MSKYKKNEGVSTPRDFSKLTGMLELFVVASASYMAYIVILGTEGLTPKVLTAPALIWVVVKLVQKFMK